MATLKGVFETRPRHHRNFVLENIRLVRANPKQQNRKEVRSASMPRRRPRTSTQSSPPTGNQRSTQSSTAKSKMKNMLVQNVHSAQEYGNLCSFRNRGSEEQINLSAKTTHYIDQENVPFEWTEVCPSIISHTICHQSVQTEDIQEKYTNLSHGEPIENSDKKSKSTQQFFYDKSVGMENSGSTQEIGLQSLTLGAASAELDNPSDPKVELNCPSRKANKKSIDSETIIKSTGSGMVFKGAYDEGDIANRLIPGMENLNLKSSDSRSQTKIHLDPLLPPQTYQMGAIPKYLSKRISEKKLVSLSKIPDDPNCPPGHILMPDNERKETLSLILKSYNDLVSELNKMPVRTDTLKMKKRKIELEKELDKLEEGIRVFSRSKVYVKLNA